MVTPSDADIVFSICHANGISVKELAARMEMTGPGCDVSSVLQGRRYLTAQQRTAVIKMGHKLKQERASK